MYYILDTREYVKPRRLKISWRYPKEEKRCKTEVGSWLAKTSWSNRCDWVGKRWHLAKGSLMSKWNWPSYLYEIPVPLVPWFASMELARNGISILKHPHIQIHEILMLSSGSEHLFDISTGLPLLPLNSKNIWTLIDQHYHIGTETFLSKLCNIPGCMIQIFALPKLFETF